MSGIYGICHEGTWRGYFSSEAATSRVLQFLPLSDSREPCGMTGSSLSSGFSSSTAREAHTAPLLTVLSCGGVTEGTSKVSVAAPAAKWVPGRNNPDSVLSP